MLRKSLSNDHVSSSMEYSILIRASSFIVHAKTFVPSSSPDVHLFRLYPFRAFAKLIHNKQDHKDRDEYVIDHEVFRTEWIQKCGVALKEDKEDVGRQSKVRAPGIPHRFER